MFCPSIKRTGMLDFNIPPQNFLNTELPSYRFQHSIRDSDKWIACGVSSFTYPSYALTTYLQHTVRSSSQFKKRNLFCKHKISCYTRLCLFFRHLPWQFSYIILLGVHSWQTQIYSCEANRTTDITLNIIKHSPNICWFIFMSISIHHTEERLKDNTERTQILESLSIPTSPKMHT
jgi:hypothetical protein